MMAIRPYHIALGQKELYSSPNPAQAHAVEKALSDFQKLLRLENLIPAEEPDSSPLTRQIVENFLENPNFADGYDHVQQLATALKPYIAGTIPSFTNQQGRTEIIGRFFDYNMVISKFAEDLRGLSLMLYLTDELAKSFFTDQFRQKGSRFGSLVFYHVIIGNTMPHLDRLISLKAMAK